MLLQLLVVETSNITAHPVIDYNTGGSVYLEANSTGTLFVDIVDDDQSELNKIFCVEILGVSIGPGATAVCVKIVDDDRKYSHFMKICVSNNVRMNVLSMPLMQLYTVSYGSASVSIFKSP